MERRDHLDREMRALADKRDALDRDIAMLQRADSLRPVPGATVPMGAMKHEKPRGRQKGAISAEWREVLQYMHRTGTPLTLVGIHDAATKHGIKVERPSIRDTVRRFRQRTLIEGSSDHGYTVTDEAAKRFGFAQRDSSKPTAAPSKGFLQ